jgi:hypothetical protein
MAGLNQVLGNLKRWEQQKKAGCTGVAKVTAANMQNYARERAPWINITGNARAGLHGGSFWDNFFLYSYIAHAVEYGVYLELANDGNYAILEESRDKFAESFYKSIEMIMRYG